MRIEISVDTLVDMLRDGNEARFDVKSDIRPGHKAIASRITRKDTVEIFLEDFDEPTHSPVLTDCVDRGRDQ